MHIAISHHIFEYLDIVVIFHLLRFTHMSCKSFWNSITMDRNFAKCEFRTTWCEILFREIISANFAKPKNWDFWGFPHSFLQFFGKLPNRIQIYSIIQYRIIELSKKSCIIMDLPLFIPIIMKFNQNLIKNWDDVWKINKLVYFSPSLTENTQKLLYSC